MKQLVIYLGLLSCVSCSEQDFDWLTGSWKRTNDQEGLSTFETWIRSSESVYEGRGYTLRDDDTVFMEQLRLYRMGGDWIYEVTGVNEHPTLFPLEDHSEHSFRCGNPDNEFPKHIEYYLEDKVLHAKISGEGSEILYTFEKTREKQ